MRRLLLGLMLVLAPLAPLAAFAACPPLLDVSLRTLAEKDTVHLCRQYAGKVVLVVNTASKCGYTDQYDGLEKMYDRYKDRGLVVLGFPSNDFLGQEPGTEAEIRDFCRSTYGVRFPMFEKIHVREDNAHSFYRGLAAAAGQYPRWNFHKYLIDRDGKLVGSFPSKVAPEDPRLVRAVEAELARKE